MESTRGHQGSNLTVRCPQCTSQNTLTEESDLRVVVCVACGNSFNLLGSDETATFQSSGLSSIGHFDLLAQLGAGAFGTVYKAKDQTLDRFVAIKMPRKGQLTESETAYFLREARTAAQLNHPNIVSVHEVGRQDDRVYIVSDLIEGVSLADFLSAGRMSIRESIKLCRTIARGLHHAHENGVIHRDLKPSNIMLDRQNEPHIMDFGLAKREIGEVTMTMDGQVLGSPAYMSPEQARGDSHRVERGADIYALGVVLFEMLTGELPFRGNPRMIMHQVLTAEPPSPRQLNATIEKDIETICLKCLEKDPRKRFATAEELACEFDRYLNGQPIASRRIGKFDRSWRWCKRNPIVAGLLAAVASIMFIGTLVSSLFAYNAYQQSLRADERAEYAIEQETIAKSKAIEASQRELEAKHVALYSQAEAALTRNRFRQAFVLNQQAIASGAGWEHQFQCSRILEQCEAKRRVLANISLESAPAWAVFADSDTLIYQASSDNHKIVAYSIDAQMTRLEQPSKTTWQNVIAASPDKLIVSEGKSIAIINTKTLQTTNRIELNSTIHSMQLSHRSRHIAVSLSNGEIAIFEPNNLTEKGRQSFGEFQTTFSMGISPDGHKLVANNGTSDCLYWDIEKNLVSRKRPAPSHSMWFTPNNSDIFGLMYRASFDRQLARRRLRWQENSIELVEPAVSARGILVNGGLKSHEFEGEGDWESLNTYLFFERHYSIIANKNLAAGQVAFYEDLCPDVSDQIRLLAHRIQDRLVAVFGENNLRIVEVKPLIDAANLEPLPPGKQIDTSGFAFAASDKHIFSFTGSNDVIRNTPDTLHSETMRLEVPEAVPGRIMSLWDATVAKDGKTLAVLWQENDDRGYSSANHFRKIVSIYHLSNWSNLRRLSIVSNVHCVDYDGSKGTVGRFMRLSSDGSRLAFGIRSNQDKNAELRVYQTENGTQSHRVEVGSSVEFSSDGEMLCTFSQTASPPQSIQVYSISKPIPIITIAETRKVNRAAFAPGNELLYVGFEEGKLETYAVPDGKLVGNITSNLAPVAVIPGKRLYFGLRLESAENGELMLSSLDHGRPIESVCESFWHRSPIFIFDSNRSAAFLTVKAKAQLVRAIGTEEATNQLQAPTSRTLAWTYSHLNDSERKTLLATKLANAEKQFEDGNQQGAITTVLGLLKEDENGSIRSIVRDYYGRSMQWQLALETSTGMSSGFHEAFHLMLLYQCNRIDDYRKTRKTILTANSDSIQDPYLHTMLIACLLMPLEQDEHDGIKSLVKRIANGRESWERAMVGKSMYRLGRYIQWHESQNRDPKHPTNPILNAFAKYQQDPSDENRKACEDYLGILNKTIEERVKQKNTGRWWHNFVEELGLATEAKRLLSQSKSSASD